MERCHEIPEHLHRRVQRVMRDAAADGARVPLMLRREELGAEITQYCKAEGKMAATAGSTTVMISCLQNSLAKARSKIEELWGHLKEMEGAVEALSEGVGGPAPNPVDEADNVVMGRTPSGLARILFPEGEEEEWTPNWATPEPGAEAEDEEVASPAVLALWRHAERRVAASGVAVVIRTRAP